MDLQKVSAHHSFSIPLPLLKGRHFYPLKFRADFGVPRAVPLRSGSFFAGPPESPSEPARAVQLLEWLPQIQLPAVTRLSGALTCGFQIKPLNPVFVFWGHHPEQFWTCNLF